MFIGGMSGFKNTKTQTEVNSVNNVTISVRPEAALSPWTIGVPVPSVPPLDKPTDPPIATGV
jgi:hypothetical protein